MAFVCDQYASKHVKLLKDGKGLGVKEQTLGLLLELGGMKP